MIKVNIPNNNFFVSSGDIHCINGNNVGNVISEIILEEGYTHYLTSIYCKVICSQDEASRRFQIKYNDMTDNTFFHIKAGDAQTLGQTRIYCAGIHYGLVDDVFTNSDVSPVVSGLPYIPLQGYEKITLSIDNGVIADIYNYRIRFLKILTNVRNI